ncbi:hypothetical protein [Nocardia macrotermitis]|uniref:Hemophore-related protein n=1 Tax=Nocardia macrotermitis TaxID=2585198 RepID=A0A7K0D163_9NOCA|nr:hypothetical protein [Nocardia macrotermitis]MQY19411.1 hypothetical protein [Nocardia macrotermitis]
MKAAALTALSAALLLFAPAFAQAAPPLPNLNPSPDQMCASTQQIVNTVRAQHPNATPDQIADNYDQMMNAKVPGYQLVQGQQHQQLLQLIHACGIR